jgi:hypothetical protein
LRRARVHKSVTIAIGSQPLERPARCVMTTEDPLQRVGFDLAV